jgi:hypothetical protein
MRTAEPVFLAPGLDSGCVPADLDSAFAAVELVSVLGVTPLEPVFGVAGLGLVGPPVDSDWAWAPAVLGVPEAESVCALAGEASISPKKGTASRLRRCLEKARRRMI